MRESRWEKVVRRVAVTWFLALAIAGITGVGVMDPSDWGLRVAMFVLFSLLALLAAVTLQSPVRR